MNCVNMSILVLISISPSKTNVRGLSPKTLNFVPVVNLKTDSQHLFNYTSEVIRRFELPCEVANNDIYGSGYADEVLSVKTAYEETYLRRGLPITYTRFSLAGRRDFQMFEWEGDDVLEKDAEVERA